MNLASRLRKLEAAAKAEPAHGITALFGDIPNLPGVVVASVDGQLERWTGEDLERFYGSNPPFFPQRFGRIDPWQLTGIKRPPWVGEFRGVT